MSGIKFLLQWKLGLAKAFTGTTIAEREALHRYAKGKKTIVEIGVYHGVNTRILADNMAPDGKLFAVDPFFPGRFGFNPFKQIAIAEVGKKNSRRVHWIEKLGKDAAADFAAASADPVNFIFIDGDHSYEGIKGDWEAWRPLFESGCIVALHDSAVSANQAADETTGSVIFTNEVVEHDRRLKRIDTVDSLSIFEVL